MYSQNRTVPTDGPRRTGTRQEPSWFEALAARLDAIGSRAASEGWPGWTDDDSVTVAAAAGEIRAIPEALSQGMREAFTTGREYGHREERLHELDREIGLLSSLLAHEAWGGRGPGRA